MSRQKSDSKRQLILTTATQVFMANGFDGTSMDAICAATGLSKATLYNYFPSKNTLFIEVMDNAISTEANQSFINLENALNDLPNAFLQFGVQFLSSIYSPQFMAARRLLVAESMRSDIGQRCYETGAKRGEEEMKKIMSRLMEEGKLRQADPNVTAAHFRALLEAEFVNIFNFGLEIKITKNFIKQAASRAVEAFLLAYAIGNHDE